MRRKPTAYDDPAKASAAKRRITPGPLTAEERRQLVELLGLPEEETR